MLVLNVGWKHKQYGTSILCPRVIDSCTGPSTLRPCLIFVPLWRRVLVSYAQLSFFSGYRFWGVAEPCCPAAGSWTWEITITDELPSIAILSLKERTRDLLLVFSQLYSLILGYRFFLHEGFGFTPSPLLSPSPRRFNCRQERHLCLVLLDWIPFSCFPKTTGCFYHDTTLLWKSLLCASVSFLWAGSVAHSLLYRVRQTLEDLISGWISLL